MKNFAIQILIYTKNWQFYFIIFYRLFTQVTNDIFLYKNDDPNVLAEGKTLTQAKEILQELQIIPLDNTYNTLAISTR